MQVVLPPVWQYILLHQLFIPIMTMPLPHFTTKTTIKVSMISKLPAIKRQILDVKKPEKLQQGITFGGVTKG